MTYPKWQRADRLHGQPKPIPWPEKKEKTANINVAPEPAHTPVIEQAA